MPWFELGGAIVFLVNAGYQYQEYRRNRTRRSLIVLCCSSVMVLFCVVDALSELGWEPAMRLTEL